MPSTPIALGHLMLTASTTGQRGVEPILAAEDRHHPDAGAAGGLAKLALSYMEHRVNIWALNRIGVAHVYS